MVFDKSTGTLTVLRFGKIVKLEMFVFLKVSHLIIENHSVCFIIETKISSETLMKNHRQPKMFHEDFCIQVPILVGTGIPD